MHIPFKHLQRMHRKESAIAGTYQREIKWSGRSRSEKQREWKGWREEHASTDAAVDGALRRRLILMHKPITHISYLAWQTLLSTERYGGYSYSFESSHGTEAIEVPDSLTAIHPLPPEGNSVNQTRHRGHRDPSRKPKS